MNLSITIHGLDQLTAKYGGGAGPIIKAVTRSVAEAIREKIARYPGPVHYPIQWASRKQQAAYFAKRKGNLPYVRQSDGWSERLGPSWTTENRDLGAVVGTRVTYAPLVQSAEKQQPMHKATGWVTDEQAIKGALDADVPRKVFEEVLKDW